MGGYPQEALTSSPLPPRRHAFDGVVLGRDRSGTLGGCRAWDAADERQRNRKRIRRQVMGAEPQGQREGKAGCVPGGHGAGRAKEAGKELGRRGRR